MTLNGQCINLNRKIVNCNKCRRLVTFRKKIAKEKRKQFNKTTTGILLRSMHQILDSGPFEIFRLLFGIFLYCINFFSR